MCLEKVEICIQLDQRPSLETDCNFSLTISAVLMAVYYCQGDRHVAVSGCRQLRVYCLLWPLCQETDWMKIYGSVHTGQLTTPALLS